MNRLSLHIEYLLLRHDCVIVPGVGAFIARHLPACVDMERGMVLPPRREIVFNSAVSNDDGMLANSVARKERITFSEGRRQVLATAATLRNALREERSVTMGRLGVLRQGDEGEISFHPMARALKLAQTEGRGEVPLRMHARNVAKTVAVENKAVVSTTTSYVQPNRQEEEKQEKTRVFRTDRNWYIPVNKRLARIAACLMLVAGVTLSIMFPIGDTRGTGYPDMASVVPVDCIAPASQKADISTGASPAQSNEEILDEEVPSIPQASTTTDKVENKTRHYLIAGTFGSEKEARKFAATLGTDGEVVGSKTLWRVSVASSEDRETLVKMLNSEKIQANYPGAWIWSN